MTMEGKEPEMQEFECSGPVRFDVSLAAGRVSITAEQRSSVEVRVQPGRDTDGSRAYAGAMKVWFEDEELHVSGPEDRHRWSSGDRVVQVDIHVPSESEGSIGVAPAGVQCSGSFGPLSVNSASGGIRIDDVHGDLTLRSASGEALVGAVTGSLDVQSASGDISAVRVGGRVSVNTASGDLSIGSASGDAGIVSVSGDVSLGGLSRGELHVRTVSGDIALYVAPGTGAWLDLSSRSGDVSSSLESVEKSAEQQDLSVHARSLSGDISISRAGAHVSV